MLSRQNDKVHRRSTMQIAIRRAFQAKNGLRVARNMDLAHSLFSIKSNNPRKSPPAIISSWKKPSQKPPCTPRPAISITGCLSPSNSGLRRSRYCANRHMPTRPGQHKEFKKSFQFVNLSIDGHHKCLPHEPRIHLRRPSGGLLLDATAIHLTRSPIERRERLGVFRPRE